MPLSPANEIVLLKAQISILKKQVEELQQKIIEHRALIKEACQYGQGAFNSLKTLRENLKSKNNGCD